MAGKKTTSSSASGIVREGPFVFRRIRPRVWEVKKGSRVLGRVVTEIYRGNRYCFRIEGDRSRPARYYRGRTMVGDALLKMDELKVRARKMRWTTDQLIMAAWNRPPVVALNFRAPVRKKKRK